MLCVELLQIERHLWIHTGPTVIKLLPEIFSRIGNLTHEQMTILLQQSEYRNYA